MVSRRCRGWVGLSLVAVALSGGCGSGVEEATIKTEEAPEIQNANNAMQDFMKNNPGGQTKPQ